MSERHSDGDVLDLKELAAYLRITYQHAGRLVRSGEIQGRQVGPFWRISRKNIDAYLDGVDTRKSA